MLSSVASSLLRNGAASRLAVSRAAATQPRFAYFSSDTHDDFAPKRKVVEGEDAALKTIKVRAVWYVLVGF
jgi:hypothetical protein